MTKQPKQQKEMLQKLRRSLKAKQKVIDVICGMEIERTKHSSKRRGETYFFCSQHCKKHFDADPEMYIGEETI